jgi:hypothetical protein
MVSRYGRSKALDTNTRESPQRSVHGRHVGHPARMLSDCPRWHRIFFLGNTLLAFLSRQVMLQVGQNDLPSQGSGGSHSPSRLEDRHSPGTGADLQAGW